MRTLFTCFVRSFIQRVLVQVLLQVDGSFEVDGRRLSLVPIAHNTETAENAQLVDEFALFAPKTCYRAHIFYAATATYRSACRNNTINC